MTTDRPTTDGAPADPRTGRRRAIMGLAGLAATGAAAVVAGAEPAGANGQGQSLTLGDPGNTASATTGLTMNVPARHALSVTNPSTGGGVLGIRHEVSGLAQDGAAVTGDSRTATAVEGLSDWQDAIVGRSVRGAGVAGRSEQGAGVVGEGRDGILGRARAAGVGVTGWVESTSEQAAGVLGHNPNGYGVIARGTIPVLLHPAAVAGPPTQVRAAHGALHVDSLGVVRAGVGNGEWRTVVGPATAGAFHVLPAPARVYDSRPGTQPDVGSKTKLVPEVARTVDLTANASGVPADATAALLTVLVVNAPIANGNLTVWAATVARPAANSLVWGGNAGRFTATPTSAVVGGQVQLVASHATHVVIDVVGFYR